MVETSKDCRSIKDPDLLEPHNGAWDEGTPLFERPYLKKNSTEPCSDPIF
jgi:hypothetical protein